MEVTRVTNEFPQGSHWRCHRPSHCSRGNAGKQRWRYLIPSSFFTLMQGYGNAAYAASLSEFGKPRHLPRCNGWLLERPILGCDSKDAMGCYPLFVCGDWSKLGADLVNIGEDLICLSLVTDPFGEFDVTALRDCFSDVMIPFKEHFVV